MRLIQDLVGHAVEFTIGTADIDASRQPAANERAQGGHAADGAAPDGEGNGARFRPVVERPTDISIFTAMLNPSKVEELA